jgi:hypothetical protein
MFYNIIDKIVEEVASELDSNIVNLMDGKTISLLKEKFSQHGFSENEIEIGMSKLTESCMNMKHVNMMNEYDLKLNINDILLEYDETVKNFQFKNPETGNLITIATAMTYKQKNPSVYMIARVLARKLLNKRIDPSDSGRVNVDKILNSLKSKKQPAQVDVVPPDNLNVPGNVSVTEPGQSSKSIVGKKMTSVNVLDQPIQVLKNWPQDLVDTQHIKSGKSKLYSYLKGNVNNINAELAKKPELDSYTSVMNQFNKFNVNLDSILKNPNDPKYSSLLLDLVKFMADMGDESAKQLFDSESKDNSDNIENYMLELIKNKNLRSELLNLISIKFPLKKVLAGKAKMKIAGNTVDNSVLGKIFNTDTNSMDQKLDPYKDKSGMPYLAYSFGEKTAMKKVAKIYITDDSSNDGNNFKFDMKLYDTFSNSIEKSIINKDNTEEH